MKFLALLFLTTVLLLGSRAESRANFLDRIFRSSTSTNQHSAILSGSLSQEQMVAGLKEALGIGIQKAVSSLGKTNGFFTNVNVRIPMPQQLQTVERSLRSLKQDRLADEFVLTMNRAAEEAVPAASGVFVEALKQITIADAKTLLTGSESAATEYFSRVTRTNLHARVLPIVQKATGSNNVTASYKNLLEKAASTGGTTTTNSVAGALGGAILRGSQQYLNKNAVDLDAYVTEKALDGLFKMIAEEEKLIRQNPQARSTELLEKVFGAIKK